VPLHPAFGGRADGAGGAVLENNHWVINRLFYQLLYLFRGVQGNPIHLVWFKV
jgi:hypothetical protein